MGAELFLILLTLCAAFVDKREMAPALLFTALAHLFYVICLELLGSTLVVLNLAMLMEMVTVALLLCLKGCMRSRLVQYLLPISILAIFMHGYGLYLFHNEYSLEAYNKWVDMYWYVVLGLFLSMSRWATQISVRWKNGSVVQSTRLLREHGSKSRVI